MRDVTQQILEAIQRDLSYVKGKVDRIDVIESDLRELRGEVAELKGELGELKEYVEVGFEAVIQQNDRRYLDHERRAFTPRRPKR